MGSQQFFLTLFVIAVSFRSGAAIQCYTCNSMINPKCGDPFDSTGITVQTCAPELLDEAMNKLKMEVPRLGNIIAVKGSAMACQKLQNEVNGVLVTARMCQFDNKTVNVCDKIQKEPSLKVTHCSICDKDLCNDAPKQFNIQSLTSYFAITCILGAIWTRISS